MFMTSGCLGEAQIKSIKKYLVPGRSRHLLIAGGIFFAIMAVILYAANKSVLALFSLLMILFFIIEWFYLQNRSAKLTVQSLKEASGGKDICNTITFSDEDLQIYNSDPNKSLHLKYDIFAEFCETEELFVLFSESGKLVPVFKKDLSAEDQKAFSDFIKTRCPNIKCRSKGIFKV